MRIGSIIIIYLEKNLAWKKCLSNCVKYPLKVNNLYLAMIFEDAFGLKEEAEAIRAVVNKSLEQGIFTEDLVAKGAKAYSTSEVGDWLVENL